MRMSTGAIQHRCVVVALGVAAALTASAVGGYTGFSVERVTLGNGHVIMNIYANFSSSGDRVFNVFRTNIWTTTSGGFIQSASNPYWKAGNSQHYLISDDSWVTIGRNPNGMGAAGGDGGSTVGDPNFVNFDDANDSSDFTFIDGTGNGAGWYNSNPTNGYGYANVLGDSGRVMLAHFVCTPLDIENDRLHWEATLTVKNAGEVESDEIVMGPVDLTFYIPAPGGLGGVALAGFAARRRRTR